MPNDDLSVILSDASKAVQALPTVTAAISQVQTDLTTQQHASVVTAAADALTVAAQSAQALGAAGLIGHNDAGSVTGVVGDVEQGITLWDEIAAFAARIKADVAHII